MVEEDRIRSPSNGGIEVRGIFEKNLGDLPPSSRLEVAGRGLHNQFSDLGQEVYDERLWMGLVKISGASGNTTALVGTPEQVAESSRRLLRLGHARRAHPWI